MQAIRLPNRTDRIISFQLALQIDFKLEFLLFLLGLSVMALG